MGRLWPLIVCQVFISWRPQLGGQAGSGEDGELPGPAAKFCVPGICIWWRESFYRSSGFHCVKVQVPFQQLCLCGKPGFVYELRGVQTNKKDRRLFCIP